MNAIGFRNPALPLVNGSAFTCSPVTLKLCSALSVFSNGAFAVTFTVSVADPNCSVTSSRWVVATWTWIPVCRYLRKPGLSTVNSYVPAGSDGNV